MPWRHHIWIFLIALNHSNCNPFEVTWNGYNKTACGSPNISFPDKLQNGVFVWSPLVITDTPCRSRRYPAMIKSSRHGKQSTWHKKQFSCSTRCDQWINRLSLIKNKQLKYYQQTRVLYFCLSHMTWWTFLHECDAVPKIKQDLNQSGHIPQITYRKLNFVTKTSVCAFSCVQWTNYFVTARKSLPRTSKG